jgi:ribokinase
MKKIAVIGSNMVDLITYVERMPVQGETLEAPSFSMGCGGKGANQAVAAAKLGGQVLMLGKVGDDVFATNTIENFKRFGIDSKHVTRVLGVCSGVAPIFVQPDSHNSILIVKGANAFLLPEDIDAAKADLLECQLIVLQLEIDLRTVYHAIEFGSTHKIPVLLNPAPAVAGLSLPHVSKLDFFVPNETELALLTGRVVNSTKTATAAARQLLSQGVRNVIVTLGANGALYVGTEGEFHVPGHEVQACDTTGAGDAFIGCFAHHWTMDRNIKHAMEMAVAYSALSVTARGTQSSYPDLKAFHSYLNSRLSAR